MYKIDLSCPKCVGRSNEELAKEFKESGFEFVCMSCEQQVVNGKNDKHLAKLLHSKMHYNFKVTLGNVIGAATMKASPNDRSTFKFYDTIEEMIKASKVREAIMDMIDKDEDFLELSDEKYQIINRLINEFKGWMTGDSALIERVRGAEKTGEDK